MILNTPYMYLESEYCNPLFTFFPFLWMLLEQRPLCHRMCKVTKETSGVNRFYVNNISMDLE